MKKLINILRCRFSYLLSLVGIYHFRHMPEFLSVEPANWCMLHCPECYIGSQINNRESISRKKNLLSITLFKKILTDCPTVHTIQFFFQGEPLLNPQLPELIRLAKQQGIYTIVSTNALLLSTDYATQLIGSGIDRIIVSIDGYSETTYQQYRVGGSLKQALHGLKMLADAKQEAKSHCIIEWQCLRLKSNQHEWKLIRRNYRRHGADILTFKTVQFSDFQEGNSLMPDMEKYSRYKKTTDGRYVRKKAYHNRCLRLWRGTVIDSQGNVLPCCFDKAGKYSFGNINHSTMAEVWHSDKANAFRQQILSNRQHTDICLNCTE